MTSTSLVSINIKMGLTGKVVHPGLSALYDKTLLLDDKLTWEEAFRTRFNARVDPDKFCVQRQSLNPIKHNLREEINVLMKEYKTQGDRPRVIYLVKIINATGHPACTVERTRGLNNLDDHPTSSHRKVKTLRKLIPKRQLDVHNDDYSRPRLPSHPIKNTNLRQQLDKHDQNGPGSDDDESLEQQDSDSEDLMDLGINNNNVKSTFCKKAENNITNTQFLKAKHELQELKGNDPSHWCNWTTQAPTTANIIRDLLNV